MSSVHLGLQAQYNLYSYLNMEKNMEELRFKKVHKFSMNLKIESAGSGNLGSEDIYVPKQSSWIQFQALPPESSFLPR